MEDRVVVGHQPQYMPYLGILNKISKADIFIIVDHVQFVKRYFHNRTYIKSDGKLQLLTIPVLSKGQYQAPISEMQINYDIDWVKKHLKSIQMSYLKAPYFKKYYDKIEEIYLKKHKNLSKFTSELLIYFIREFDLVNDIRFSSSMNITENKTEMLIALTKAVNGNMYLSGAGARDYFDDEVFSKSGFKHAFMDFKHSKYPQQGDNVLDGIGCIDLLFNCGSNGREYIVDPEVHL